MRTLCYGNVHYVTGDVHYVMVTYAYLCYGNVHYVTGDVHYVMVTYIMLLVTYAYLMLW